MTFDPETHFLEALRAASEKLRVGLSAATNIKSELKYIEKSIKRLYYTSMEVKDLRRRNVRPFWKIALKQRKPGAAINTISTGLLMMYSKINRVGSDRK